MELSRPNEGKSKPADGNKGPAADVAGMFDDLTDKSAKLRRLESTIDRGLQSFMEVGHALLQIRDEKLYHPEHLTFDQYCAKKWRFDRSYAYRFIAAAKVVDNLTMSPIGDILPVNEAQTRPLGLLPADKQREAWSTAVKSTKGKMPTASRVQTVVNRMRADIRDIRRSEGWNAVQLAKDDELKRAFDGIASVFGQADTQVIRNGIINYSRTDVITLSKQPKERLLEMQDLVMRNHWTAQQCLKFFATEPDKDSTIEDLIHYCLSTKDKVYTVVLQGFEITCKNVRFARSNASVACVEGSKDP